VRERIGVCVSSNPAAQYLIARGSRMAQAMGGEFFVFYVDMSAATRARRIRRLWRKTFALPRTWVRTSCAAPVEASPMAWRNWCARTTSRRLFLAGRPAPAGSATYILSAIQRFLRDSPSVDVHIVTQEAR
jgi:two-component system, OmpR family, sensor histidine kinase KdpD